MRATISSALKLRHEEGPFDLGVEYLKQPSGITVFAERDGAKSLAGQFTEMLLSAYHRAGVVWIKVVPRIAVVIHHDLDMHQPTPTLGEQLSVNVKPPLLVPCLPERHWGASDGHSTEVPAAD
jgi:hypothetical protein